MADFMREGGEIQQVRPGESGLEDGAALRPPFAGGPASQPRTPALDVLAAIDARRKGKQPRKAAPRRQPRKKIIYDDFGEPLREIWEES